MSTDPSGVALGWLDESLPVGSHVCCYYADEDTLREMLGFLRVGLLESDVVNVIFADESRFDPLLRWLGDGYGGDLAADREQGRLVLIGGQPTLDGLVRSITDHLDAAVAGGCRLIRFLGFIGWGRPGWPDDRELLEFESRVNDVVAAYPAIVLCTYGLPVLLGPQLIGGGLQTHPTTVIGDRVVRNSPFYGPSAESVPALVRG